MMNREEQPYLRKAAANGRSSEVAGRRGDGVIGPHSAPAQASAVFAECLLLEMVSGAEFMFGQWWTVSFYPCHLNIYLSLMGASKNRGALAAKGCAAIFNYDK
jgi:hypothetical protein